VTVGLFKELVLLPLAPVRGTTWVAEQIAEEADRQLYDEDNIKRELVQLQLEREDGLISEQEQEYRERELLDRLAVARQRAAEEEEAALPRHEFDDEEVIDGG
jgi:cytochrome c-type biogenesis protein CcmH/NrfG